MINTVRQVIELIEFLLSNSKLVIFWLKLKTLQGNYCTYFANATKLDIILENENVEKLELKKIKLYFFMSGLIGLFWQY